jgi:hypothetical protein
MKTSARFWVSEIGEVENERRGEQPTVEDQPDSQREELVVGVLQHRVRFEQVAEKIASAGMVRRSHQDEAESQSDESLHFWSSRSAGVIEQLKGFNIRSRQLNY